MPAPLSTRRPRPEGAGRRSAAGALVAAALIVAACGGPRPPQPSPPAAERVEPSPPAAERVEPSPPARERVEPPAESAAAGEGSAAPAAAGGELTVVIDPGGEGSEDGRDLVAAARSERERRREAGRPTAVITDDTLPEYAVGELTVATPAAPPVTPEAPAELEARLVREGEREQYWRQRVLAIRTRWRQALDRVAELEGSAAELRRRFYAEDDPYYRDTQIKPAWDRALETIESNRETIERAKAELERTLEEGRQAGALPGWLREGVELEPEEESTSEEAADPLFYEAQEPQIVDEDGEDGG